MEHLNRPADAPPIDVYDGVELPYANAAFDAVWCKQVLEHIRYPDTVIAEVVRVLDEGGLFLGSVSQLEPYHSRSIFNWTHYGIRTVFADHGLEVLELTPGVDRTLLIMRALFGYDTGLNKFFREGDAAQPGHRRRLQQGWPAGRTQRDHDRTEQMKVAGHIHFVARKAGGA